ncbi:unnamed protein product [Lampetra fluviatilis]
MGAREKRSIPPAPPPTARGRHPLLMSTPALSLRSTQYTYDDSPTLGPKTLNTGNSRSSDAGTAGLGPVSHVQSWPSPDQQAPVGAA